ncbi:hypothetical protein CORC01_03701 [Colletotrichum orchidophilum]|uniref:Uncharacterized protein n=1 Tax=Colletotrichum orchidophilum TaxID=1209926 RepID=A0A1G4BHR2_9PEZI|nr:uncharacterized protein CORC01_03701 [Colletotrichum orchidophilum]OHF00873.1 hypothetical protein CORC01_03701 [Colletotrichum orchidophilum]
MGDWGHRVNIVEMQQMYLEAVQVSLVDMEVDIGRYEDSYVLDKVMRKNRVGPGEITNRPRRTYEDMELDAFPSGPWINEENPEPLGGTRNTSAKAVLRRNLWWKMIGAVVRSAFLVGPMWLLVLNRELYLKLGVARGFVFAFGLLMVGCVDRLEQVFIPTLRYAAVLMAFVGVMFDKQFPEGGGGWRFNGIFVV